MSVAALGLAAAALLGATRGTLVDRVIAVIDKQVLTQTELLAETRIALALREGEQAAAADLDASALAAFRDYTISQVLVAMQARRLGAVEVAAADVERELTRFAQRFRSADAYRAFLRRFDIGEDTLRYVLERNLRNERFITERMRLLGGDAGVVDPASAAYQQALRKWLDELRDAADLRLVGPTGELELQPKRAAAAAEPGR